MDIETGEYVRTYNGYIAKVTGNRNELILDREIAYHGKYKSYLDEEEKQYVKHSHNIINLIEVGDFVNGREVGEYSDYDEDGNDVEGLGILYNEEDNQYLPLDTIDIKTILTHEQMEANCYRLEN